MSTEAEEQRVVAQLKNESGERLGSTFDLPLSVTAATLQQICNALLQQVVVTFYSLFVKLSVHVNYYYYYYYYYNCFTAPWTVSVTTRVSWYQKGKTKLTNLDLLEQEIMSGSGTGIGWAICKSAPRLRQITMPASNHSVFTGWMPFLLPN